MTKITFKTDDEAIVKTIDNFISGCTGCYDLEIVNGDALDEGEVLELIDGFKITNSVIAEPDYRYLLRDAIAKHIVELEASKDTPAESKFSVENKCHWYLAYEAAKTAKLIDCGLSKFIDQMYVWFPNLVNDRAETKVTARRLQEKMCGVSMVDWDCSPLIKYRKRKWAKGVAYYGLYLTLVKMKKTFKV